MDTKRILCVDDNEDTSALVAFVLVEHGYEVTTVGSFAEALDLVLRGRFDLCLLDTWLPDGSGIELCARIRRYDPAVPILFLSAVATGSYRTRALRAGAADYLVKPFEMSEVLRRIDELVHSSKNLERRAPLTPAGFAKSRGRASKKPGRIQSA